jgi:hypothetical protein
MFQISAAPGHGFGSFGKTAGFPLPYFIDRYRGLALMRADMQQVRQAFGAGAPGAWAGEAGDAFQPVFGGRFAVFGAGFRGFIGTGYRGFMIRLKDNGDRMFAVETHGTAAEGVDSVWRVAIKPDFCLVLLVMAAGNLGTKNLNAHAFHLPSQILHPVLAEITLSALDAVGVEDKMQGIGINEHG